MRRIASVVDKCTALDLGYCSVFRGSQAELGADMAYWDVQVDNDTHIVDERSVNAYSVRQRADSTYSDNVHTQHRAFTPHFRHMPYEFRKALVFTSLTVYEGSTSIFLEIVDEGKDFTVLASFWLLRLHLRMV